MIRLDLLTKSSPLGTACLVLVACLYRNRDKLLLINKNNLFIDDNSTSNLKASFVLQTAKKTSKEDKSMAKLKILVV